MVQKNGEGRVERTVKERENDARTINGKTERYAQPNYWVVLHFILLPWVLRGIAG